MLALKLVISHRNTTETCSVLAPQKVGENMIWSSMTMAVSSKFFN